MSLFTGKAVRTIERYLTALNSHDLSALNELIDDDACYVDSCGYAISGRDLICDVIAQFFEREPNFKLHATEISEFRGDVLIRGSVDADDAGLREDHLWRARTDMRKITYWQSFADRNALSVVRALAPAEAVTKIPLDA